MSFVEDTLLYAAVALIPAIPTWIYSALAWSGRYRSWAPKPVFSLAFPTAVMLFHKHNYFPLVMGVIGIVWTGIWIGFWLNVYSSTESSQTVIIGASIFGVVMINWWPQWLTPKWHKDWIARGGGERPNVPLWNPAEHKSREPRP